MNSPKPVIWASQMPPILCKYSTWLLVFLNASLLISLIILLISKIVKKNLVLYIFYYNTSVFWPLSVVLSVEVVSVGLKNVGEGAVVGGRVGGVTL